MRRTIVIAVTLALAACGGSDSTDTAQPQQGDGGKFWVTSERLDRHTCPARNCGIVGRLFFGEATTPLEEKGGWVRITKEYDGSCVSGRSQYVDRGNARCTSENGFVSGRFSEWVEKDKLSDQRPADPAATATGAEEIVKDSDDFGRYRKEFARIAAKLISDGRCNETDFTDSGGFTKSVTEHRDEPVYFVYCGGYTSSNKIYVNAKTGQVDI